MLKLIKQKTEEDENAIIEDNVKISKCFFFLSKIISPSIYTTIAVN